jgi:hypothetical protein
LVEFRELIIKQREENHVLKVYHEEQSIPLEQQFSKLVHRTLGWGVGSKSLSGKP